MTLSAHAIDDTVLDAQIETLRKGNFAIRLSDGFQAPLVNRGVAFTLNRLDFPIGTAISDETFRLPQDDSNRQQYLETIAGHFTCAVHENALKWTPRPAAQAFLGLIHDAWVTPAETMTDEDGMLRFRGFYGHYTLTVDGQERKVDLSRAAL